VIPFFDLDQSGGFVYPLLEGRSNPGAFLSVRKDLLPAPSTGEWQDLAAIHLTDEEGIGQTLVVDRSKSFRFTDSAAHLPSEGGYVIAQGGRLFTRHLVPRAGNIELIPLQPGGGHGLVISSGTPDFWVVGRVLWIGQQPQIWTS
jgi:hypothetical protein